MYSNRYQAESFTKKTAIKRARQTD